MLGQCQYLALTLFAAPDPFRLSVPPPKLKTNESGKRGSTCSNNSVGDIRVIRG